MKPIKAKTLGILIIIFWVSFIPYLYPTPFQPNPKLEELAESIVSAPQNLKEIAGVADKTKEGMVQQMMRAVLIQWAKLFALILMGAFTGLAVLKSFKNTAKLNTIFYAILFTYYAWGKFHIKSTAKFLNTHLIMFQGMPIRFTHHEIIYPIVCMVLCYYFFKNIKAKPIISIGK